MCLATPMRIVRLIDRRRAVVAQGSFEAVIDVSLIPEPHPGDHVIIHAGYAIEVLSLQEADERLALFRRMAELAEEPEA